MVPSASYEDIVQASQRFSTGNKDFDTFLHGGYERGVLTTIYGPAGSGKTNLCLLALIPIALQGKEVLYIDTEANFSLDRLKQLTPEWKRVLKHLHFLKPTTFSEQHHMIITLHKHLQEDFGLVIVDSIGALYRLDMSRENVSETNKMFGFQLATLTELALKKHLPLLLTNQVYSSFDDREKVQIVGGDIIKYTSKTLIELKKGKQGKRLAVIKKHRSLPEEISFAFRLVQEGIDALHAHDLEEKKTHAEKDLEKRT